MGICVAIDSFDGCGVCIYFCVAYGRTQAALIALVSLVPYYALLYLCVKMSEKLAFTIKN